VELAPLQAPLKAGLIQLGLSSADAELLVAVVGHPLAVMPLGELRPVALERGPGLFAPCEPAATFGFLGSYAARVGSNVLRQGRLARFGIGVWCHVSSGKDLS